MIQDYPCTTEANSVRLHFPTITCDDELPRVSVLTITRNRPEFYCLLVRNMQTCDYPKHLIEWVLIEDGESRFDASSFYASVKDTLNVKYSYLGDLHFPIGYKRNTAVKKSTHDLLVHVDDDDYYPPESILARVRCLYPFKDTLKCVGCLKVRTFHLFTEKTYEAHESSAVNMSESSLAYTRDFWEQRKFENKCSNGEGISFLKDRYHECRSLPHMFVIVQFDHDRNTVVRRNTSVLYEDDGNVSFLHTVDNDLVVFINDLRNGIAQNMPETKEIVSFIKQKGSMQCASSTLHELTPSLQRHPLALELCRTFPGKKTKERGVVFYCGSGMNMSFGKRWDYDDTSNIGGSEEAVLLLAKEWCRHTTVTVYNERDDTRLYEDGRIVFRPWYTFRPLDAMSVFVSWRDPSHFEMFPSINCTHRVLDLHDYIPSSWIKKEAGIHFIFAKSTFQAERCVNRDTRAVVRVVPNGVRRNSSKVQKERMVLCTSSPERCWIDLFRLARDIHAIDPSFRFVHAYDYSAVQQTKQWDHLKGPYEENTHVELLGHVPLKDMNALYKKAALFVYPTLFPEIDCVSLTKAIDASCVCIHTSAGALYEKSIMYDTICIGVRNDARYKEGFALNEEEYTAFKNAVINTLNVSTCDTRSKKKVKTSRDVFTVWYETLK